jgi:ankyrin repeat protein
MIEEIYKQIFTLIKQNKFKNLEELLIKNKDINLDVCDENNNYIIHHLINLNKIDLVKILLDRNIRLDILDIDGRNILYYPIKFNYTELLDLLLEYNNKIIGIPIIDIKDNLNNTPLHYGTLLNNLEIVKKLIDNNADPFLKNKNNDNVLELALKYGYNKIIEYILNKNPNLNFLTDTGETFLQLSIIYQNDYIINLLISKHNININNQEKEYCTSKELYFKTSLATILIHLISKNTD